MLLSDKLLIFSIGGIKLHEEQVLSIYQWPAILQQLFQKQFYISDSMC